MLTQEKKTDVIKSFSAHEHDSGSSAVQIALLTERINYLHKHFEAFPKDVASKLGLMKLVNRRRSLLDYVRRQNAAQYEEIISRLKLRK